MNSLDKDAIVRKVRLLSMNDGDKFADGNEHIDGLLPPEQEHPSIELQSEHPQYAYTFSFDGPDELRYIIPSEVVSTNGHEPTGEGCSAELTSMTVCAPDPKTAWNRLHAGLRTTTIWPLNMWSVAHFRINRGRPRKISPEKAATYAMSEWTRMNWSVINSAEEPDVQRVLPHRIAARPER